MEMLARFGVFIGVFLLMAAWEVWLPKRRLSLTRRRRWPVNIGLTILSTLLMRISIGAAAWQTALWAQAQPIGLFNSWPVPHWPAFALSLILLDLAIYAQHIAAHRWRWLWRLHQVHHSDPDFDTTTAVRFHPFEIVLSMLYKVMLVAALGVDPMAVIVFEIVLNGCALFNHGNVGLPPVWERYLRYLLVTPDMHRIHHSALQQETDSNYGFSLSCWDRLFKTYTHKSRLPQSEMSIGLNELRDGTERSLIKLLLLPFQRLRAR
jgi:sterol desaturase/sphingolipid hydroxylase (fatty acid hydroxylase superfamily)